VVVVLAEGARGRDVDRPRTPRVEGRDPGALSQRRLPRSARLVRHPRRRRGVTHLLRERRRQREPQRGRDDRRLDSLPRLAVHEPEARDRAKERGPQRHGCGRGHQRRRCDACRARAAADSGESRRQRGPLLRRPGRAAGGYRIPWRDRAAGGGECLHHARSEPPARGARRRAWRARARRRVAGRSPAKGHGVRAGGPHRRRPAHRRDPGHGRRPVVQQLPIQPRDRGATRRRAPT
jgi:hypothetical protein